jgi:hypothetical protein
MKQNPSLQENLLLGNISPKDLAVMSYEEMASDQVSLILPGTVKTSASRIYLAVMAYEQMTSNEISSSCVFAFVLLVTGLGSKAP